MSSTDSDSLGKVVGMPSEQVVGMARNEWTASVGIDGRHGPDYAGTNKVGGFNGLQPPLFTWPNIRGKSPVSVRFFSFVGANSTKIVGKSSEIASGK